MANSSTQGHSRTAADHSSLRLLIAFTPVLATLIGGSIGYLYRAMEENREALLTYKTEVAQTYVAKSDLEARLSRIEGKIDRLFDVNLRHNGG